MHSDEQLPKAAFLLGFSFWLLHLRAFGNNILVKRKREEGKNPDRPLPITDYPLPITDYPYKIPQPACY
jgi:hypothetical protein